MWKFQPTRQGISLELTIKNQRKAIKRCLKNTPSLKSCLNDRDWLKGAWEDGQPLATNEIKVNIPSENPWTIDQILDDTFSLIN